MLSPMLYPFIQPPTDDKFEKFGWVKSIVNILPDELNPSGSLLLSLLSDPPFWSFPPELSLSESSPVEHASKNDSPKKAKAIVGQTFFKNSLLFSNFFFI